MNFDKWIGREVDYISGSGRHYVAVVGSIPEKPEHGYTNLPSVNLSFINCDRPNKYIQKRRVPPRVIENAILTWAPLEGGKQLWEKREDDKMYFCD